MHFLADLVFLLVAVFLCCPDSDGKLERDKRSQDGVTNTLDTLIEDILSENYDNTELANPGHGTEKRNVGQTDGKNPRDTRDDETASGITLNSDPIRPALSLEDKADLLRIKSHLHAIKNQLDDIKLAPRTKVTLGEQRKEKVSPAEEKFLQPSKSAGETADERPVENVISKKVIHRGKKLSGTKINKPNNKVSSESDYRQPLSGETLKKKQKKVLFENDIDKGKKYEEMPGKHQQQVSSGMENHHNTMLDETVGQGQGGKVSSGIDNGKSVDGTENSEDFYHEAEKKNVWVTPFPRAFMGFSPTRGHPMKNQQESPLSTLGPPQSSPCHKVGAREVTDPTAAPSLKKYIAESFIKAFDILKVSLVKIDKDLEQGLRQMYSLETDHYNMATGDIRANGDKIERLQKYISNEMNVVKGKATNLTNDITRLTQNIQKTVDRLVNITETLLNMTRTINDRTERINEIKEKELKMVLATGNPGKYHPNVACRKHHHLNKGHSEITKQLKKQLRKQRQKLKHPLYYSLINYLKRQHKHPHKQSKFRPVNTLATVSNITSSLTHKKLKKGPNIRKSLHRSAASHIPKQKPGATKRETAEQKEPRIKPEEEIGGDEDSQLDSILQDDTDMN